LFYKALLISILIHVLILSWAGSSLPFLTKRTKAGSSSDQQVEYRIVTLVELPPPSAMAQEERPARVPASSKANSTEKTVKQTVSLDRSSRETREALPALPAQAAEELPPILTRSEAEPAAKKTVPSPLLPAGEPGPTPSVEDEPMVSHLQVDAVTGTVAEKESETAQVEKSIPSSVSVPANAATATVTEEDVPLDTPLSDGESALRTDFTPSSVSGSSGNSTSGERSTLPAELENGSASGPVKVFHTDPVYPRLARRRGWEGTVYLAIRIAPQGEVIATEIIESSGYEQLDQAALEAVSHWRYAWASGQPAAEGEIFTIKIRFQLED